MMPGNTGPSCRRRAIRFSRSSSFTCRLRSLFSQNALCRSSPNVRGRFIREQPFRSRLSRDRLHRLDLTPRPFEQSSRLPGVSSFDVACSPLVAATSYAGNLGRAKPSDAQSCCKVSVGFPLTTERVSSPQLSSVGPITLSRSVILSKHGERRICVFDFYCRVPQPDRGPRRALLAGVTTPYLTFSA
jgi:hypothetical protein